MKISVIIPTYKPKDYLWECLDSLVHQTCLKEDFEVIIVLNGCTEPWKGQIEEFITDKMQGMNINFIHTEQGGVSNARNIALDVAKGDYVTFIDDDDFVSPQYLDGLYNLSSEDIIALSYPFAFNDGTPEVQRTNYMMTHQYDVLFSSEKMSYPRARKFFSGPCMKLIPMSFIQGRKYDIRFKNGEDSLFMFLISDKFKYVRFGGKNICYYRRFRENSAYTRKRSIGYRIKTTSLLMRAYTSIYMKKPLSYNFSFFITRLIGAFRSMFY